MGRSRGGTTASRGMGGWVEEEDGDASNGAWITTDCMRAVRCRGCNSQAWYGWWHATNASSWQAARVPVCARPLHVPACCHALPPAAGQCLQRQWYPPASKGIMPARASPLATEVPSAHPTSCPPVQRQHNRPHHAYHVSRVMSGRSRQQAASAHSVQPRRRVNKHQAYMPLSTCGAPLQDPGSARRTLLRAPQLPGGAHGATTSRAGLAWRLQQQPRALRPAACWPRTSRASRRAAGGPVRRCWRWW